MDAPFATLHSFLDRLTRRERGMLVLQSLAWSVAGLAIALVAMGALLSHGAGRSLSVGVGASLAIAGTSLGAWLPLRRRWVNSGLPLVQARRVEALRPELRGRLVTCVDHSLSDAPHEQTSMVLLERAARRANGVVDQLSPSEVLPARPLLRRLGWAGVVFALCLMIGGWLPVGPLDAMAVALGDDVAEARLGAADEVVDAAPALVGDIVIRYLYPEYTGIDAVEVYNSDGTIHAPPGTAVQIRARTAEPFDSAALQLDDGPPRDIELEQGRALRASIVVGESGTWRFLLFRGDEVVRSPAYEIQAEDDAAPVVTIQGAVRPELPIDAPISLRWSAQDDFGLKRVLLEWWVGDAAPTQDELRVPLDPTRELRGSVRRSPRQMGLAVGDQLNLRVVAEDNDLLGGSKRGESELITVMVVGPRGRGAGLTRYYEQLRDALVPALADFLVEPLPPASSRIGMNRWAASARARFDPADAVVNAQWGALRSSGIDGQVIGRVTEARARLFRYALTTWEPGATRRVTEGDAESFEALHAELVLSLEGAIIVLDQMLRRAALERVVEKVTKLAEVAQRLAANVEDADAAEILTSLDELMRQLGALAAETAKMDEGGLREFINSRSREQSGLIDEIRKAVAEGRLDDAREMMRQLAESTAEMAESMQDRLASQQQGEDEVGQAMEKAADELEALAEDERALAEDVRAAREELGPDLQEMVDVWNRLDALADAAVAASSAAVQASGDLRGWRQNTVRRLETMQTSVGALRDAIAGRDAEAAVERCLDAERPVVMARKTLETEAGRARPSGDAVPDGVAVAGSRVREVDALRQEIMDLLLQLDAGQTEPVALQEAAQQLSQRQAELSERGRELSKQVRALERQLSTSTGEATKSMERASEAMERAEESLEGGSALAGEGHSRDAAKRLDQARERLGEAMERERQMQRSQQRMSGEGSSGDGGGEGGDESAAPTHEMDLPAPEDFQTPEEYRRAILQGMQGDVPDEFKALKEDYFEELVRQ